MAEREYVKMERTKKTPESVIEILGIHVEGRRIVKVPKADVKEFQKWGFELVKDKEDKKHKKHEKG